MGEDCRLLAEAIYRALVVADREAYIGIYRPGEPTTVDGQFNLDDVADVLLREFWCVRPASTGPRSGPKSG